jgi:hypothetical protein
MLEKRMQDKVEKCLKEENMICSFELFKVGQDMNPKETLVALLKKVDQIKEQCLLKSKSIR